MKHIWFSRIIPIAAIYAFRMLGLFLLIPVFSIAATTLENATPTLIGLALGSYGLTQGLLQIPFGMLSDRFGRKPMITIGLLLFAIGSLIGALTQSIEGMIIARMLQGAGAIGSVLMALLTDLTPDHVRTKAMAMIGATIGVSFSLSMIISPAITHQFGLPGIFYLSVILASLGLLLLHTAIPTPQKGPFQIQPDVFLTQLHASLKNRHLQRLNIGIFFQHLILTATFFAVPMILQQHIHQAHLTQPWHFYLPLMMGSFIMMLPFIMVAERKQRIKPVFIGSVSAIGCSQLLLAQTFMHWTAFFSMLFVYFIAFNILEANLPSLISRQAPTNSKGTAMGIYSSSQFLGIFVGGALAGTLYQQTGFYGIFTMNGIISAIWVLIAIRMQPNHYQLTLTIPYINSTKHTDPSQSLKNIRGVEEAMLSTQHDCIYLRVNKATYQPGSAEEILKQL